MLPADYIRQRTSLTQSISSDTRGILLLLPSTCMKSLTVNRLFPVLFIFLSGCSDNSEEFESTINLLTAAPWWHMETVGTPASGYSSISPLVFNRDRSVRIGLTQSSWKLSNDGKEVLITYPSANYQDRYLIVNLTNDIFQFRHISNTGIVLAEVKYDHCEKGTLDPC
jgi:hypothetical protein